MKHGDIVTLDNGIEQYKIMWLFNIDRANIKQIDTGLEFLIDLNRLEKIE